MWVTVDEIVDNVDKFMNSDEINTLTVEKIVESVSVYLSNVHGQLSNLRGLSGLSPV